MSDVLRRGRRGPLEALRDLFRRVRRPEGRGAASSKGFVAVAATVSGRDFNDYPVDEFDNSTTFYDDPTPTSATIEGTHSTIQLHPASRRERVVNILSPRAVEELVGAMIANAQVLPVTVGWRSHRPEDMAKAWMSTIDNVNFKLGVGTRAYWEVMEYLHPTLTTARSNDKDADTGVYKGGALKRDRPEPKLDRDGDAITDRQGKQLSVAAGTPIEQVINIGHLFWRATHRTVDGGYRLLPSFGDVSHQAEGYHYGSAWKWTRDNTVVVRPHTTKGFQIQIVNLESHAWNELRKQCHAFGLSVRWGEGPKRGQFYVPGEPVVIPGTSRPDLSMCPHAHFGVPCYMPLPGGAHALAPSASVTPTKERFSMQIQSPQTGLLYDIHGLTPRKPMAAPSLAGPSSVVEPVLAPGFVSVEAAGPSATSINPVDDVPVDPDLPMPAARAEPVPWDQVATLGQLKGPVKKRPRFVSGLSKRLAG